MYSDRNLKGQTQHLIGNVQNSAKPFQWLRAILENLTAYTGFLQGLHHIYNRNYIYNCTSFLFIIIFENNDRNSTQQHPEGSRACSGTGFHNINK